MNLSELILLRNTLTGLISGAIETDTQKEQLHRAIGIVDSDIDRKTKTLDLRNDFSGHEFSLSGSAADRSIVEPIETAGGVWEPYITKVITRLVKPTDICLDIGANIGPFSLCLSRLATEGKVHAFEPSQEIFFYLAKNVETNKLPNVVCYNIGLSDTEGEQDFHTFADIPGASFGGSRANPDLKGVVRDVFGWDFEFESSKAKFQTLDHWAAEHGVSKVDFVKIDVEGAELLALSGQELIRRERPTIVTEFNFRAMKSYFSVDPENYFDFLRSIYDHIYVVHEEGVYQVTAFDQIANELTKRRFWTDLLCTTKELSAVGAQDLLSLSPAEVERRARRSIIEKLDAWGKVGREVETAS